MAEHHRMFVDGEWIEAADGGTFAVSDPATGEVIASVADGGPAEATRAVEAAHRAFPAWAAMPARERAPILHRIQSLMEAHREDLALQVTRENGKPLEEARREVTFALGYFGWFAEEARRAYGDLVPSPAREKRLWGLRQPLGVVAAITPWNFPATMVRGRSPRRWRPAVPSSSSRHRRRRSRPFFWHGSRPRRDSRRARSTS